jgi:hypothetical protein
MHDAFKVKTDANQYAKDLSKIALKEKEPNYDIDDK